MDSRDSIRAMVVEQAAEQVDVLVKHAAEALGDSPDAMRLTADEELLGFQWRDPGANEEQVWIEEYEAARQAFPWMGHEELIEEARPNVGARLYSYRVDIVGSGGRTKPREQAEYAERLAARVTTARAKGASGGGPES